MKKKFASLDKNSKGIVLISVLLIALLLTFVGLSLTDLVIAQYGRTSTNVYVSNALFTAEAGIDRTLNQLNEDNSFAGYTSETEFFNDADQGRGTYTTTIENGTGPNERIITSTGRTYRYGKTEVISERSVKVSVVGTASPGYSVQTGPGGLNLSGSATITNSELYVNGFLNLSGAASIGTSSQPLSLFVAHYNCPPGNNPGPTYPSLCTSGQPINMSGSSRIYGSVCATNQTTSDFGSAEILPGSGGSGLIPNCDAPQVAMPTYDRAAHIASMTTTGSVGDVQYNCSQWWSSGGSTGFVRTLPANMRLNGNANWSSSCDLTITGNVYITGNLDIGGAARIRIADSLGTTRPVILVDGDIDIGGSSSLIPNSSGTAAHFISFKGSGACNLAQTCSGTPLKTSQGVTTVDVQGAGNYPGTIFHSYWGTVELAGSGNMGSAIGQTVDLSGAGTIIFGTSLSTGTTTWTIRSYQYDYN